MDPDRYMYATDVRPGDVVALTPDGRPAPVALVNPGSRDTVLTFVDGTAERVSRGARVWFVSLHDEVVR